jgi:hypothetical protein
MGLTRDFFTKPIIVPVTFRFSVPTKKGVTTKDFLIIFEMIRETVEQKNSQAVASSLFSDSNNFDRFCKQLAKEPQGIDDFPKGDSPLEERAREYFAPEGYRDLIQHVVMEVERAQKPSEFFQSFQISGLAGL